MELLNFTVLTAMGFFLHAALRNPPDSSELSLRDWGFAAFRAFGASRALRALRAFRALGALRESKAFAALRLLGLLGRLRKCRVSGLLTVG